MFGLDGLTGGIAGYFGQRSANAANAQQAQIQMGFQERMSNTSHQREVADLRAAGLNPILSGKGGSGASSPGGAMATMGNTATSALQGAQTGQAAANARNQQEILKWNEHSAKWAANTSKTDYDAQKIESEARQAAARLQADIDTELVNDPAARKIMEIRKIFGDQNISQGMRAMGDLGSSALGIWKSVRGNKSIKEAAGKHANWRNK